MEENNNLVNPELKEEGAEQAAEETKAAEATVSEAAEVKAEEGDGNVSVVLKDTAEDSEVEAYDIGQSDNKSGKGMGWYVVHTYSGYEGKVKTSIENATANRHLEDKILEVRVPMQDVTEVKNNVKKTVQKKMFPGYVMIHMDADDNDAWYVVRNTRGVTGFVGPGSKPAPLSEEDMAFFNVGDNTPRRINLGVKEGDQVSVISGVWQDTVGVVTRVDEGKQVVVINVDLFGRQTPVEIAFADVKKL